MKRLLPLLILTGLLFGQDTLRTVSGQVVVGKYIKTTDTHITFHIDGQLEPALIKINSVKTVKLYNNTIVYDSSALEYLNIKSEKSEKTLEERQVIAIEEIAKTQKTIKHYLMCTLVINIMLILFSNA